MIKYAIAWGVLCLTASGIFMYKSILEKKYKTSNVDKALVFEQCIRDSKNEKDFHLCRINLN